VDVTCPSAESAANARVILTAGQSGNFLDRIMKHGHDDLHYNLYVDRARQHVAGDGTGGTSTLVPSIPGVDRRALKARPIQPGTRLSPRNTTVTYPFYGAVHPGQRVPAKQFHDNVRVEVEF
jgi:spore coat protein U-like protein